MYRLLKLVKIVQIQKYTFSFKESEKQSIRGYWTDLNVMPLEINRIHCVANCTKPCYIASSRIFNVTRKSLMTSVIIRNYMVNIMSF